MAKSKGNKNQSIEEQIAFLTDAGAKQKGIPFFDTGGTAGKEGVGNLRNLFTYVQGRPETRDKLGLVDSEINPFVTSDVAGKEGSKQMMEYWASDTMPQLPKSIRKQFDVVYAGTREPQAGEQLWNPKSGFALNQGEQNIWRFVRKPEQIAKAEPEEDPLAAIPALVDGDGDRPVTIGTTTYSDPNRAADPSNFLSSYIRSTALPLMS